MLIGFDAAGEGCAWLLRVQIIVNKDKFSNVKKTLKENYACI